MQEGDDILIQTDTGALSNDKEYYEDSNYNYMSDGKYDVDSVFLKRSNNSPNSSKDCMNYHTSGDTKNYELTSQSNLIKNLGGLVFNNLQNIHEDF
jgi:hypothetical protein